MPSDGAESSLGLKQNSAPFTQVFDVTTKWGLDMNVLTGSSFSGEAKENELQGEALKTLKVQIYLNYLIVILVKI